MTDGTPTFGPTADHTRWSRLAGALCALQALVLLGVSVFYLVELMQGQGSNPTQVVMSAALIVVFAALLGVLAWLWWRGSARAVTPTLVWCVVLGIGLVNWGMSPGTVAVLLLAGATIAVVVADSATRASAARRAAPPGDPGLHL